MRDAKDAASRLRHLHTWFDGFRTLKLLHALQRSGLAQAPWYEALRTAPSTSQALFGISELDLVEPETLRDVVARLALLELNARLR
jgi:hypothetical protein